MTAADVIDFYVRCENLGIQVWIAGGWGVDALLGEETRLHADLHIIIWQKDVLAFRELLETGGYKEIKLEIARPHNFVLGDGEGREIDVHVIVFNDEGNIVYGSGAAAEIFPGALLSGTGKIDGYSLRCISPEWQVKWHTGYKLRESDLREVSALCERFSIEYPEKYAHLNDGRV